HPPGALSDPRHLRSARTERALLHTLRGPSLDAVARATFAQADPPGWPRSFISRIIAHHRASARSGALAPDGGAAMSEMLARYWWALVLRGIAGIVFGVLALLWPGITLEVLVIFFGAYMLVDGVFAVISAIGGRAHTPHWGWLLLEGLLGIAIGIFTFVAPVVTAFAL